MGPDRGLTEPDTASELLCDGGPLAVSSLEGRLWGSSWILGGPSGSQRSGLSEMSCTKQGSVRGSISSSINWKNFTPLSQLSHFHIQRPSHRIIITHRHTRRARNQLLSPCCSAVEASSLSVD